SAALALLFVPHDALLPVASVEMFVLEPAQVHTFEASRIDVDAFGIGARNIKRCNAAIRAEEMLCDFRVEGVGRDIIGRREQPERGPRNDPVEVALLRANRAVAFRDAIELAPHLEAPTSTMASAAHCSFAWFFSHERFFNAPLAARKPGRQRNHEIGMPPTRFGTPRFAGLRFRIIEKPQIPEEKAPPAPWHANRFCYNARYVSKPDTTMVVLT